MGTWYARTNMTSIEDSVELMLENNCHEIETPTRENYQELDINRVFVCIDGNRTGCNTISPIIWRPHLSFYFEYGEKKLPSSYNKARWFLCSLREGEKIYYKLKKKEDDKR
jgi:hypothetical protein